jgi:hypothetical protein
MAVDSSAKRRRRARHPGIEGTRIADFRFEPATLGAGPPQRLRVNVADPNHHDPEAE